LALCILLTALARGQEVLIVPENGQGVYQPGQTIRWNIQVKDAAASRASFVLKTGGLTEMRKGEVSLSESKGQVEAQLDGPGWLLLEVTVRPEGEKQIKALGGALVAPEKLQ